MTHNMEKYAGIGVKSQNSAKIILCNVIIPEFLIARHSKLML